MNAELLKQWIAAKKAEDKAKAKRLEIEGQIEIPSFEGQSKTFDEDGFKVTLKKNETYAFDQEKWSDIRKSVPADLRPEKISYSVDKSGLDYLKENNLALYKTVSDTISFKSGKIGFKVEKD